VWRGGVREQRAARGGTIPCGPSSPAPAALLTSQLCRIDIKGEKKDQWMRLPKAESSVTQHRLGVGGKSFDYTAPPAR